MLSLGPLSFAAPWALLGFVILAAIWWLLRLYPPAPRQIAYPPVRILRRLARRRETPARTPWWLLLPRLAITSLVILAAADPLINAVTDLKGKGPIYLIVDDDWAAARDWPSRRTMMLGLADQAEREGRSMVFVPTAPPQAGVKNDSLELLTPAAVRQRIESLQPKPWATDRDAAMKALEAFEKLNTERPGDVFWVSNGIEETIPDGDGVAAEGTKLRAHLRALQRRGSTVLVSDGAQAMPWVLRLPEHDGERLSVTVECPAPSGRAEIGIRAISGDGRLLTRSRLVVEEGERRAVAEIDMPLEFMNCLARLEIEESRTVAATVLLDERWRHRPIGLVSGGGSEQDQPLLSDTHYLGRALGPFTEVRAGTAGDLLKRELAVLVLIDPGSLGANEEAQIVDWIDRGGVVLRFAGRRLAESEAGKDDKLLPVEIRRGDRIIGGAMSWTKPETLAPFDTSSPFFGLPVSRDVKIRRQVLARPSLDLAEKTWARLRDGTPLVTAEQRGRGWLILVHATANAEWSDLPLSGLFVDMLRRVVEMSQGVVSSADGPPLRPLSVLDAYAVPDEPNVGVQAIPAGAFAEARVSPENPPGFYGTDIHRRALNFSSQLNSLRMISDVPEGVAVRDYEDSRELDLKSWLLLAASVLFVVDTIASLAMRGLLPFARAAVLIAGAAVLFTSGPGHAEDDVFALASSLETRLAYVITGDNQIDETSQAGLSGLNFILKRRTAAELGPPQGVHPGRDELSFFPLIYWPIVPGYELPGDLSAVRINKYLRNGGVILFDTRDQSGAAETRTLRRLAGELDLPALVPVPADHVLTRAFYLLDEFPGRWSGGTLWVERVGERVNDGVSPIIAGGHDWAAAWAMDEAGRPMYPVVPGGERQREMAFRFGVNLVMYTLTGNYKADQVHLPAILRRLGQ